MNDSEFRQALHKYRDEEASMLHFMPRIECLIDGEFCRAVSKMLRDYGADWEKAKATPTLGSMLPDVSGLYMFVWRPELSFRMIGVTEIEQATWILYVGKAGVEDSNSATIKSRYNGEYAKYVGKDIGCLWSNENPKDREALLSRYLTLRPLEFWYLPMDDITDLMLWERKLIRILRPPLNKQHGATLRSGKTHEVK